MRTSTVVVAAAVAPEADGADAMAIAPSAAGTGPVAAFRGGTWKSGRVGRVAALWIIATLRGSVSTSQVVPPRVVNRSGGPSGCAIEPNAACSPKVRTV